MMSRAMPILFRPHQHAPPIDERGLRRLHQYTGQRAGVARMRDGKVGDSGAECAAAVQL